MKAFVASVLLAAACSGACNRPDSPPPPVVPVQPQPPMPPAPQTSAPEVAPIPKEVPLPAPKAAPANPQPDAPESAATAPAVVPDPSPIQKPAPQGLPPTAAKAPKPGAKVRDIHQQEGSAGCVEMYGTCTPPPDRLCTSSALYVDCGKKAQVPSTTEWVSCVCP